MISDNHFTRDNFVDPCICSIKFYNICRGNKNMHRTHWSETKRSYRKFEQCTVWSWIVECVLFLFNFNVSTFVAIPLVIIAFMISICFLVRLTRSMRSFSLCQRQHKIYGSWYTMFARNFILFAELKLTELNNWPFSNWMILVCCLDTAASANNVYSMCISTFYRT